MTPRDVINLLPFPEVCEIAGICIERMTPEKIVEMIYDHTTEDEMLEVGMLLRKRLP